MSAQQTTSGKDGVCYKMLAYMTDNSLEITLNLFNQIWDIGQHPSVWKQPIIVPVLKPGKDPPDPASYRPIALKIKVRMITKRITYFLENKNLLSPYQSAFRRGSKYNGLCIVPRVRHKKSTDQQRSSNSSLLRCGESI